MPHTNTKTKYVHPVVKLHNKSTAGLQRALDENEQITEELLQQYYLELATDGEERDTNLTAAELADRVRLYKAVREDTENLKAKAAMLLKSSLKASSQADELETRLHDVENSRKKIGLIPAAPANSVIDLQETQAKHFARGLNWYKAFLVFFIGSFAGVVSETLWCIIRNGYIESRAGLVYGPLNALYGAGALALTLALYKYRNRSSLYSFAGGMLIGSAVEYICSWGQEMLFGSRSWDYSGMPFNLNGRICLLYSLFWGVLGVFWIKSLYPRMARWILKIPNRIGVTLTWILLGFMIFNCSMSAISMARWAQRVNGSQASNSFEEFIDRRFPDERMERIFANMKFGDNPSAEQQKHAK